MYDQTLINEINRIKDSQSLFYPYYYQLDKGWACQVSTWAQKPLYCLKSAAEKNIGLIRVLAIGIWGLPALIGYSIDTFIHFVKSERITQAVYDAEFNEWLEKEYTLFTCPNSIKEFIDFCIRNRIKARDCPFQCIIFRDIRKNHPRYLFEADGVATNIWMKYYTFDKQKGEYVEKNPMPDCLVVWDPEPCMEKEIIPSIESVLGEKIVPEYPSSLEFRNYYKINPVYANEITTLSGAIDKCSFAIFSSWSPPNAKTIDYLRNSITQIS